MHSSRHNYYVAHHACACRKKRKEASKFFELIKCKVWNIRDAINSKETKQGWPSVYHAYGEVVQWMVVTSSN